MKIRSITCFYDPGTKFAFRQLDLLAEASQELKQKAASIGIEVQSIRLATPPFPRMVPTCCDESAIQFVTTLERDANERGFLYISFGPALPDEPSSYKLIPSLLANTRQAFFGAVIADKAGIHLPALRECAQVICQNAALDASGFTNLRFAALANTPAFVPFFPAAYAQPGAPASFALALETADLAVSAFESCRTLEEGRKTLLAELNDATARLARLAEPLADRLGLVFHGFDCSLAPFPEDWCSLGNALEKIGVSTVGFPGSLAACSVLTSTLDQGSWKRVGFNGLFMPVLEDSVLARRAAQGALTLRDLLISSAVCGAGLDTVPLPGDASPAQLEGVLLDLAALALRLNKPLTARLMPVPRCKAGDETSFSFDFFANSRVMDLPPASLKGLLAGDEVIPIFPRICKENPG